jgi:hypothetical protein
MPWMAETWRAVTSYAKTIAAIRPHVSVMPFRDGSFPPRLPPAEGSQTIISTSSLAS